MKKIIILILGLWSLAASAQTVGQFRYDTTKFLKVGGRNHVKIENLIQTSDSVHKPLVVGADGVIKRSTYWPGSGGGGISRAIDSTYRNAGDSGTVYRFTNATTYTILDRITKVKLPCYVKLKGTGSPASLYDSLICPIDSLIAVAGALKVNISDTAAMLQKYKDSLIAHNSRIITNTASIALKANQSALVDTAAALRSLAGSKPDTGSLVKITLSGLRDNDLLKYDSVNNRFINFRLNVNAPIVWNRSTNTLSADTTTAITGLATKANVAAGGVGGSTDTTSLSNRINQRWSLLGNTGTDSTINFLGTTDIQPIIFRQANAIRGMISSRLSGVFFGATMPSITSAAVGNTFVGWNAGQAIQGGVSNVAYGSSALTSLTTGSSNTAVGFDAGMSITGASFNALLGLSAGRGVNSNNNALVGYYAGAFNTGSHNAAIGGGSLGGTFGSGTGGFSFAGGANAGGSNTNGSNNIFLGPYSGYSNTTVSNQFFVDYTDRGNYDGNKMQGLMYGVMSGNILSQYLSTHGKFGINRIAPSSYLHLTPGSQAAGLSSLKFGNDSIATTAATGNGATATITFAAQNFILPIGSTVRVTGITPSGYNGTFAVSASTATSVSFGNATTGAQTVAGRVVTGILQTTPESGAMESDRMRPYFTGSDGVRGMIALTFTGTAAPATTPSYVGDHFIDTVNKKEYVATGTTSSADWTILN